MIIVGQIMFNPGPRGVFLTRSDENDKRNSVLRNSNVKIGFLITMHTCLILLIIDYRYRKAVYAYYKKIVKHSITKTII